MKNVSETILAGLSDRQQQAVKHTEGPLLLVAGPGSGKTRVMAHRLAYLVGVNNIPADRILAVTFTNKAARELKERCERLVDFQKEFLQVRTFHGFCARVLRFDGDYVGIPREFSIFDEDDQKKVIRRSFEDENIDIKQHSPGTILNTISRLKNSTKMPDEFAREVSDYGQEIASRIYSRYQSILDVSNAVDFDDLLLKTFILFNDHKYVLDKYSDRFKYIQIDEFQDTNPLQFKVSKLLSNNNGNICVVGDPDQSIYSWRYADPSNLTDFKKSFPKTTVITLDQSYRSTKNILDAANSLIVNNPDRTDKNLWTDNDIGSKIAVYQTGSEEDEARIVLDEIQRLNQSENTPLNEIAIMYRVNAQSRAFEVLCQRLGIRYRLIGGVKFYERQEVKDVLAYLRIVNNKSDDAALLRVINTPRRGISDKTVAEIIRMARENNSSVFSIIAEIYSGKLTGELIPRAIKSIKAFFELLEGIFDISDQLDITDLINFILERTDYISYIRRDEDKGLDREENINELKASSDQYTGIDTGSQLSSFLENVALVSNVDNLEGGDDVRPSSEDLTLITLHQAKGLEYDAVFLVGCEEGLLPHVMSIGEPDSLEEERRICYVGITRAKNNLYFSYSLVRRFRGVTGGQMLSRFVNEIPENLTIKKYARGFSHPLIDGYLKNSPNRKFKSPNTRPLVDEKRTVQFSKGTKVKHDLFGDGIIIKNEGNEGEVVFLKHGVKRLMWQYAPMIVIEKNRRPENDSHDFVDPEIDTA